MFAEEHHVRKDTSQYLLVLKELLTKFVSRLYAPNQITANSLFERLRIERDRLVYQRGAFLNRNRK